MKFFVCRTSRGYIQVEAEGIHQHKTRVDPKKAAMDDWREVQAESFDEARLLAEQIIPLPTPEEPKPKTPEAILDPEVGLFYLMKADKEFKFDWVGRFMGGNDYNADRSPGGIFSRPRSARLYQVQRVVAWEKV